MLLSRRSHVLRALTPRLCLAPPSQPTPGTYQFKIDTTSFSATPFKCVEKDGETEITDLEPVSAGSMYELEAALYKACKEKSGIDTFTYMNAQVTPKVALWSACIGTAIGGGGGGGGVVAAAAPAAAAGGGAAAAKAAEPEPEPEEEEEDMGFDLFD